MRRLEDGVLPAFHAASGQRLGRTSGIRPSAFQSLYEVDELVDFGDSILARVRIRVRGAQSGATGTQSGAVVIQLRDVLPRHRPPRIPRGGVEAGDAR